MSMAERNTNTGSSRVQYGEPPKRSHRRHTLTNHDRQKRLGRVQRQIRRCLIALGRPVRIRDLLPWCYPSALEFQPWMRAHIHRTIGRVARPVGKTRERYATTWGSAERLSAVSVRKQGLIRAIVGCIRLSLQFWTQSAWIWLPWPLRLVVNWLSPDAPRLAGRGDRSGWGVRL